MTMRAVCREAQLSQRFFYESFTDTDDLLREVYRATFFRTRAVIDAAIVDATDRTSKIRAGVDAAARVVREDPRVCRILLVEPVADRDLRQFVRDTIVAMIWTGAGTHVDDSTPAKMRYATAFGAIISLFLEWTEGNLGDDRAAFVEHVTALITALPSSRPMR